MEQTKTTLSRMEWDRELESSQTEITVSGITADTAAALGHVIDKWRFSQGWQPLSDTDHDLTIAAWFEILNAARVPPRYYNDCYLAAMAHRATLKAQGKDIGPLSADDLVVQWKSLKDSVDTREVNGRKLLPENAAAACQRCFGKGIEEMPDGTPENDCDHRPLSNEEITGRLQAKARAIQFIRDSAKKIAKPVPAAPLKIIKKVPTKVRMQCTGCGRRVTSLEGWTLGETCGLLIDKTVCTGVMRVSDEAIAARM